MVLGPRAMLRFRHADAVVKPKPNRPATIASGPIGARYSLFYGSTFKRGGSPVGAVVADPAAAITDDARQLAEHLGAVIDERTYFHGSMMSEVESMDASITRYDSQFPNDHFDTLLEQSEDSLLAFHAAWQRLSWIQPRARAFALDMLWWKLELSPRDELALTLLLCDGLRPTTIAGLRWAEAAANRTLLPRTRSLIQAYAATRGPGETGGSMFDDEAELRAVLERCWNQLCQHGLRARPRVHLPEWSRVPDLDPG